MLANLWIDEAVAIHKVLGEHGALWLTEQLTYFAESGDTFLLKRFNQIAVTYGRLGRTA